MLLRLMIITVIMGNNTLSLPFLVTCSVSSQVGRNSNQKIIANI